MIADPITLIPEIQYGGTVPPTTHIPITPSEYCLLKFVEIGNVDFAVKLYTSSESLQTMLLSEDILRRDWDSPEEDEAWAHL